MESSWWRWRTPVRTPFMRQTFSPLTLANLKVSDSHEAQICSISFFLESSSVPLPSSNLVVPTPSLPLLPLIDIATLELPADQQEPTELTLFGLKKSALDPGLVGLQDLEIRHGASEQVGELQVVPLLLPPPPTRWSRTHQGHSRREGQQRETP